MRIYPLGMKPILKKTALAMLLLGGALGRAYPQAVPVDSLTRRAVLSLSVEQMAEYSIEDLMRMSEVVGLPLDELVRLVEVSNRSQESLTDASSVVSSLTGEQLLGMGLTTLKEGLSFFAGCVVDESVLGTSPVNIRGIWENFNQKVLFLVDGRPYWMSSHGDIPLLAIPLQSVERIELSRGPGGILYGTNASAGVVNVVLKHDGASGGWLVADSHGRLQQGARFAVGGDGYALEGMVANQTCLGGIEAFHDSTTLVFPFTVGLDPRGRPFPREGTLRKGEEFRTAALELRAGGLELFANFYGSTREGLGGAAVAVQPNRLRYTGAMLAARHSKKWGLVELGSFVEFNPMFLELSIDNFVAALQPDLQVRADLGRQIYQDAWRRNHRLRGGAKLDWLVLPRLRATAGLEAERRAAGRYLRTDHQGIELAEQSPRASMEELGAFAQLDWRWRRLRAVAGGRFVWNSYGGSRLSPRMSLIYNQNDYNSLRLIYSEGFNSPVLSQVELEIPYVVRGNPELEAETIRNLDLAFTHASDSRFLMLNAYLLRTQDVIARLPDPRAADGATRYGNSPGFARWGIEGDLKLSRGAWMLMANAAYNAQGNRQGLENDPLAALSPRWLANLGIARRLGQAHTLALSGRSWGQRDDTPAQSLWNLAYTARLDQWAATVSVQNLLGRHWAYPILVGKDPATMTFQSRQYLTLALSFGL